MDKKDFESGTLTGSDIIRLGLGKTYAAAHTVSEIYIKTTQVLIILLFILFISCIVSIVYKRMFLQFGSHQASL